MAIDPPYRLDPFRNLINIHWESATEQPTFDGLYTDISPAGLYGDRSSYGANNDKNYWVHSFVYAGYPSGGWLVNGAQDLYTTDQILITTTGNDNALAYVEDATNGLFFAGTWSDIGSENPKPYGTWGIDLSGYTATKVIDGELITMQVQSIDNIELGEGDYAAWLYCLVHWSS